MIDDISKALCKNDSIKRVGGTILAVEQGSAKAIVQLVGESNVSVSLTNKSGEVLSIGDYVWVYYWHSLADGYIAIRCGSPNYLLGSEGDGLTYIGELPIQARTKIDNAYILSEETSEYITNYSYDVDDYSASASLSDVYSNGIGSDTYSVEFQHYIYNASCSMYDGTNIFFSWVPRRVGTGSSVSAEGNLHTYSDLTITEIIDDQIVNIRYYIKSQLNASGEFFDVFVVAIDEDGTVTESILDYNVAESYLSRYRIVVVVGNTDTDEDNSGHVLTYNDSLSLLEINATLFQATYNEATGQWGVLELISDYWYHNCKIATNPKYIATLTNGKTVTQSKERRVIQ